MGLYSYVAIITGALHSCIGTAGVDMTDLFNSDRLDNNMAFFFSRMDGSSGKIGPYDPLFAKGFDHF